MSQVVKSYIVACAAVCSLGAVVHLAAIPLGANWYAFIGAPRGLIHMLGLGSLRPAITCVAIATVLAVWSAYGLSAAGWVHRLPGQRLVLALVSVVLIGRSVVLPVLALHSPAALDGICGRCQQLNGFVLATSALCLLIGVGYAVAALQPAPNNSCKPKPLRGSALLRR